MVSLLLSACATSGPLSWPLRLPSPSPAGSAGTAEPTAVASGGPVKSHTRGNKSPYQVFGETYHVMPSSIGYVEIGIASWYGKKFHGRLTSNGEVYDMYQLSAAHKALPLPSVVRVTNLDNGRKVIVRVNDRGPFHSDRVIDLSYQTALALGFADQGTAPVVIEAVDEENYPGQIEVPTHHESFYLQVGAFSNVLGAEQLLAAINGLMGEYELTVDARILQSEQSENILHKVWLGPIKTEDARDTIAQIVQTHNLGVPLRVKVD